MKRDPHLIRALLLHFEGKPDESPEPLPRVAPYTDLEILYHLLLMHEGGLLRCEVVSTKSGRAIKVIPFSLTWQGHEFLDASRDSTLWKKATQVAAKFGGVPFEVLKALLLQLAKKKLGIDDT